MGGLVKTFDQLSPEQQDKARDEALDDLLEAIVEGAIRFNDELNGDTLQASIDAAMEQAEELRTPWFAGEIIMDAVGDVLRGMAECDAEDALYPEGHERIIEGVAS